MDQDEFNRTFDELMLDWEREISKLEIDKILARKIEPLLARIEHLEEALKQLPARGQSLPDNGSQQTSGREPINVKVLPKPLTRTSRKIIPANPYEAQPGRELDALIHLHVMKLPKESLEFPSYSTDMTEAKKVLAQLKNFFDTAVISGRTAIAGRSWFARFASTSNHGTEVLADTLPLAICRLALLIAEQSERRVPQSARSSAA